MANVKTNPEKIQAGMLKAWGAPIVARAAIEKFSGGVRRGRSLANLEVLARKGEYAKPLPKRVELAGRKVAYDAKSLAKWIVTGEA